jgi:hypothetical protein
MVTPDGSQPRGRRGTVGHPYTALDLRLALAIFGFLVCTALLVVAIRLGLWVLAIAAGLLVAITIVDLAVIQVRRHRRSSSGGKSH